MARRPQRRCDQRGRPVRGHLVRGHVGRHQAVARIATAHLADDQAAIIVNGDCLGTTWDTDTRYLSGLELPVMTSDSGAPAVMLYTGKNFTGSSLGLQAGRYNLAHSSVGEDTVSSFTI